MGYSIRVDHDRCIGIGNCEVLAPALFALDEEEGHAEVLTAEPSEELRPAAEAAEASCPMAAIELRSGERF